MAVYPGAVSADANLFVAVNNRSTTLNGAINDVTTTIVLTSSAGFPTAGYVTIDTEAISYTGITVNTLTGVTRGADGTTNASHVNGALVQHTVIADHHNVLKDEVIALETHLIPGQHTGTATTDNAAAGKVGEYVASVVGGVNYPTTNEYGDLTSISLTAGDWDVWAQVSSDQAGATWTHMFTGISVTTGNSATGLVAADSLMQDTWASSSTTPVAVAQNVRIRLSINATTTIYLKFRSIYSAGQPVTLGGKLAARRAR